MDARIKISGFSGHFWGFSPFLDVAHAFDVDTTGDGGDLFFQNVRQVFGWWLRWAWYIWSWPVWESFTSIRSLGYPWITADADDRFGPRVNIWWTKNTDVQSAVWKMNQWMDTDWSRLSGRSCEKFQWRRLGCVNDVYGFLWFWLLLHPWAPPWKIKRFFQLQMTLQVHSLAMFGWFVADLWLICGFVWGPLKLEDLLQAAVS